MIKSLAKTKCLWLVIIAFLQAVSCQSSEKSNSTETPNSEEQLCFLFTDEYSPVVEGRDTLMRLIDSTSLTVTVSNEMITGTFHNKPAEKDAMIGTIEGRKNPKGWINALYHYTQEGGDYNQFVQILLTEDKAHLRFVNDTNQVIGALNGAEWFSLPKVKCKTD